MIWLSRQPPETLSSQKPSSCLSKSCSLSRTRTWDQTFAVPTLTGKTDAIKVGADARNTGGSTDELEASVRRDAGGGCARHGLNADCVNQKMQVVSLGSYCGVKISLRRLGLGDASLPFDWMRTSSAGLVHWLTRGFDEFFKVNRVLDVRLNDKDFTIFRSDVHSFWHDDINDPVVREKIWRRIRRFLELDVSSSRDLLFIRSVAGTPDLREVETLFTLLKSLFEKQGRRVFMCVIVEDQPVTGPIFHKEHERLFFWVQGQFTGTLSLQSPGPYEDAIAFAVRWVQGEPNTSSHSFGHAPPVVSRASDILRLRQFGLHHSMTGVWAGLVQVKGMQEEVHLAAFEGYDKVTLSRPVSSPRAPQRKLVVQAGDPTHLLATSRCGGAGALQSTSHQSGGCVR